MKKIIAMLLILSMLALCACGETPAGESEEAGGEPSAESANGASETESENAESEAAESESADSSVPEESEDPAPAPARKKILLSLECDYTVDGTLRDDYPDYGQLTDGAVGGDWGTLWETSGGSVVIDLGEARDAISGFNIWLRGGNWGIVLPEKCEYFVSGDGENWTSVGTVGVDGALDTPGDDGWIFRSFPLDLDGDVAGQYVKMTLSGKGMNYIFGLEAAVWQYIETEPLAAHEFNTDVRIGNEDYTNPGHMGDDDGPAYCVYSKTGYNKAEFVFELSKIDIDTLGSAGSRVNAFVFLGIDVYYGGYWANCCDAGIYYKGENLGWQLFVAVYDDGSGEGSWYHGGTTLDDGRNYKITLDSSKADEHVLLIVTDADSGETVTSREFELPGAKADGSNTSYLTNIAVDWAGDETWVDVNGAPTEDWVEVMRSCEGQGIHAKNIRISGCGLYKGGTRYDWTEELTDRRCLTPDAKAAYGKEVISVRAKNDVEYIVDIDLG